MRHPEFGRGFASLYSLQLLIRVLHGLCAVVNLCLFSYFLATLSSNSLTIGNWVRAVEGISGSAVGYALIAGFLLWRFPGRSVPTFVTMVFDVLFGAAFIYVAVANRGGSGSCSGEVNTVFGSGNAETNVRTEGTEGAGEGSESLPGLGPACRMQKACLITACIAIVLLALSPFLSVAIVRQRKRVLRKANKLQPGSGVAGEEPEDHRKGWFGSLFGRNRTNTVDDVPNPNALPEHPTPQSLETSQTAVGDSTGQGRGGYGGLGDGSSPYNREDYEMDSSPKRTTPYSASSYNTNPYDASPYNSSPYHASPSNVSPYYPSHSNASPYQSNGVVYESYEPRRGY
ncbi:hypothetical protein VTJ04DRAFT_6298 [Mycothermus thermophilus]|uniref:uncharacterized protein n=1 Tax=Humicola insolens TaxID=85995 RepID=UPI0037434596